MALRPTTKTRQYGGRVLVTPPAEEPVTAAELQSYLKMDSTTLPDTEANNLITEARQYIEQVTGIAFVTQVWQYFLDNWPVYEEVWWNGVVQGARNMLYGGTPEPVLLPIYPVQTLDSIITYDENSAGTAVVISSVFDVDTAQKPARFALKQGATWPIATRTLNAIEIEYTAGFGAASDVPQVLKRAVLAMAAGLYSHRGDDCELADIYRTSGAAGLMATYTVGESV